MQMFSLKVDDNLQLDLLREHHVVIFYTLLDRNREHLATWVPWVTRIKSSSEAAELIKGWERQYARNDGLVAGIWFKGELAGIINLNYIQWQNRCTNIGYWLGENFQGQGIITKSCRALINYAFHEKDLHRIEIDPPVSNLKSCAVAERLGFYKEGIQRQKWLVQGEYVDGILYSLLAGDWQA
jgi:ribosomal-protein-serine acetyltransferase